MERYLRFHGQDTVHLRSGSSIIGEASIDVWES